MRAMLSDSTPRWLYMGRALEALPERANLWPGFWGTLAEMEAQRIMEAAEPLDGAKPHMTLTVHTRDYEAYRVACDCLADALERLCEMPAGVGADGRIHMAEYLWESGRVRG